ncbi:MAG: prefoldin subunit alpha [Methanomicrobiales archaeon]|nr:prefoldin subunit alpha [Methanomicrobiales archaeon]
MVKSVEESDVRELQALQMYLNEYTQQGEVLARQLELLMRQRMEASAAIEALKELKSVEEPIVLFPLGGGTTVRAHILDPERVLVNIGADVIVQRTNGQATEYLEDRIRELEALEKKVGESLQNIRAQVNEIARRIETGYEKARGG